MTYDELNAALSLQRKIDRLQARLDDLRQSGGITHHSDNSPVMGGDSVFAGQIASELEEQINALKKDLEEEKVIIRRYIDKLDLDDIERKLMILRYVDCWPWDSVKKGIGYSLSRTYHYHSSALEKTGADRSSQDLKAGCQV